MTILFKNASLQGLKPERKALFLEMAQAAVDYSHRVNDPFDDLQSMIEAGGSLYHYFLKDPLGQKYRPAVFGGGAIDFGVLIARQSLEEIDDLDDVWTASFNSRLEGIQSDLMSFGLHGLHFRSNMATQQDRFEAVTMLSQVLHDLHSEPYAEDSHFPVGVLSVLIRDRYETDYQECEDRDNEDQDREDSDDQTPPILREQINALLNLGLDGISEDFWNRDNAIDYFVSYDGQYEYPNLRNDLTPSTLAIKIEQGFQHLVYNQGYRLKALSQPHSLSHFELRERMEPIVDRLLAPLGASDDFVQALKRQVMINLFSAFPDGLVMFDAQPEELQGVMLNPVLLHHPDAQYFTRTLAGPVHLFSSDKSTPKIPDGVQVIKFLSDAGYPIHIDIALNGILANLSDCENLIDHAHGYSAYFDTAFATKRPISELNLNIVFKLLQPAYLVKYSDAAVMNLIGAGLEATSEQGALKHSRLDLKGFLAQRPEMKVPVLEFLEASGQAHLRAFKVFGFGERELSLMKNPPESLIEALLGSDLGL